MNGIERIAVGDKSAIEWTDATWNPLRWMRSAAGSPGAQRRCSAAIELAGLQDRRDAIAANISHGEQRQLDTEYKRLDAERQAQATNLRVEKTARRLVA